MPAPPPESSEIFHRSRGATIEMPIERENGKLDDETGGHVTEI